MKLISRNKSILTRKSNLEKLVTLKNFPVFFGCTEQDSKEDIFADMKWSIDPETGIIQLTELIPPDILYQTQHVDGIGNVWEDYYNNFAEFILEQDPSNVFEIGGGQGRLAEKTISKNTDINWTIIEPNPTYEGKYKIKLIPKFFEDFSTDEKVETIIFSQLLEHTYDPNSFLQKVYDTLSVGGKIIFAYPNLELWVKRKYTNSLNFEHTMFLTDYHLDYLLARNKFKILKKQFYIDHSIFYIVMKVENNIEIRHPENKYLEYKRIFLEFINVYSDTVRLLNNRIRNYNSSIYLFGAHIFSQYLLCLGLNKNKIISILDNSKLKQGKRLYGTNFFVESPEVLRGQESPIVILKTGIYNEEIKKDIIENINSSTIFWE